MIKKHAECAKGNHLFIISNWAFDTKSQKANAWTCQRCMLTVEGMKDIQALRAKIHETGNNDSEVK